LEPLRFGSVITVLVVDEDVGEVKVVVADLLRTHAELISVLSPMRLLLKRLNGISRRDSALNTTRKDTVFFNALNSRARLPWERQLRSYDGGKVVILTNLSSRLHVLVVLRHC
jgi:hypothetical protein